MMELSNSSVCALVENYLYQQTDVYEVNFIEVVTSLTHGDTELFLVCAHVQGVDDVETREFSLSIELKERVPD